MFIIVFYSVYIKSVNKCLSAASCPHLWSGWQSFWYVAVPHIIDPLIVYAHLGVDGGVGWVFAAVSKPLHTLQLAIAHHHAASIPL